ncbi:hypothetical protein CHLRE_05g232000v5 [Chlamydomonas reinhardtii]|uniref:J domain-containing protein n=1 Tax=Chlamydomonas reinhardtii TaxID=3055 RepID=A0A2K3DRX3_CHLRE|nr:uncharacterized protein CHLRE_05g232000v5 [Chlamydomonas reinhardtii]PNW83292.1 hypothetical protein CHLRE_05g232000v5 [Chlamydomonas reinhardtii]
MLGCSRSAGLRPGTSASSCSGSSGAAWRTRTCGGELRSAPWAAASPEGSAAAAGCCSSSPSSAVCAASRPLSRRHLQQHQRPGARGVACDAYGRGGRGSGGSSDPNYYELLGLEPDCDEEDIKTAFRRRAKELHPDVNKEDGATESFVRLSRAYEVLSDPEARRQYDIQTSTRRFNFFRDVVETAFRRRAKELHPDVNKEDGATESFVRLSRAYEVLSDPEARRQYDIQTSTRRFNFFRDVVEDEDDVRRSPFKWSQVSRRQGGSSGLRPDDDDAEDSEGAEDSDDDEEDEKDEKSQQAGEGEGEGEEDEQGPGWQRRRSPEEFLEDLARAMGGAGSLRDFQSGRLDPWGTSSSDSWFRQVERQTHSPYGPYRQGYGSSRDDDDGGGALGREWDPSRRTPGWTPPGRGSEWDHPRRQWDEEDRRGGGPGRQGGGGGGGGDFRRPFKI